MAYKPVRGKTVFHPPLDPIPVKNTAATITACVTAFLFCFFLVLAVAAHANPKSLVRVATCPINDKGETYIITLSPSSFKAQEVTIKIYRTTHLMVSGELTPDVWKEWMLANSPLQPAQIEQGYQSCIKFFKES